MTTLEKMKSVEAAMNAVFTNTGVIGYYRGEQGECVTYSYDYTTLIYDIKGQREAKERIKDAVHSLGGKIISHENYYCIIALF